ncbi:MAG: sigma-70 family RNA polymerase sigma factor [Acidobacteriota bacterium]
MEDAALNRVGWTITQEAFDKFLVCLDADRVLAGEAYERVRSKLISFFAWRGFHFAEDHADETINRVVRKIDHGDEIRDVSTYVFGVARMLTLELLKEREKHNAALNELPPPVEENRDEDEDAQIRIACLKQCLQNLTEENRDMILAYYTQEKGAKIENRKRLAERLKLPLNALRIRALRVREKLEKCITHCQKQMIAGRNRGGNLYRLERK